MLDAELRRFHRVALAALKHRHARLFAHHLQLLDGRRAVDVASHKEWGFSVLLCKVCRELACHGGLARALKAREQDHGRRSGTEFDFCVRAAHELGHLFVYDFDDLLAGREAFKHLRADRALRYGVYEAFDDREVHVRLQKRELDLAHGFFHVLFIQLSFAGKLFEHVLQFGRKPFKRHSFIPQPCCKVRPLWRRAPPLPPLRAAFVQAASTPAGRVAMRRLVS